MTALPPKDARRRALRNPTAKYVPNSWLMYGSFNSASLDGKPFFTWFDVPRMVRDPQVRFIERMARAPFQQVKFVVKAEDPRVRKFIASSVRRFWQRSMPKLFSKYWRFGYAPGGAEFHLDRGLIRLDRVKAIEPPDSQPRTWLRGKKANEFAGFTARNTMVGSTHAMWFAGYQEFSTYYDFPPIAGLFTPWLEKNARNGAIDMRVLWERKNSSRGAVLYYPPGESNVGTAENPRKMDNQDIARSLIDYGEANSTYALESIVYPNTDRRQWVLIEPTAARGQTDYLEYPKVLDREMLTGACIPPEVIEAAEVGSGWSGRMVPLMVFLGMIDELVGLMLEAIDGWLRYLVAVNFGPKTWFQVDALSLCEQVMRQAKSGKDGGEGPNPVPDLLGVPKKQEQPKPSPVPTGAELSEDRDPIPESAIEQAKKDLGPEQKTTDLNQLLAYAMLLVQERFAAGGHAEEAEPYVRHLADLADDPARLRSILTIDMSWSQYEGPKGGKGWKNDETGRIKYGGGRPGEKAEKQQASAKRASQLASLILHRSAKAEDLTELADHLPALTVEQLHDARVKMGAEFGGSRKRRQELVDKLLRHVKDLTIEEHEGKKPAVEDGRPDTPVHGKAYRVPTESLHVDPERFQFKLNTDKSGVTDELKGVGTFNPELAGTVAVWRDPEDGKDYVVNGHHRRELAGRTGASHMNVLYIDAKDAKEARARGALVNIAEGRGTSIDAAKFLRDSAVPLGRLQAEGISLKGRLADEAGILTKLNDRDFQRLTRGEIELPHALAIARHVDDHGRQQRLFQKLTEREDAGKDTTPRHLEEMARQMAAVPSTTKTESTLWGDETTEEDVFDERAELAAAIRADLAREVNDFAAGASERRAEKLGEHGNVLDVGTNKGLKEKAEQAKNLFDQLAHLKGPISDALNAGAIKLKQAKTKKERDDVRRSTAEVVRNAIAGEFAALDRRQPIPPQSGGVGSGSEGGEEGHRGGGSTPPDAGAGDSGGVRTEPDGLSGSSATIRRSATDAHEAAKAAARSAGKDSLPFHDAAKQSGRAAELSKSARTRGDHEAAAAGHATAADAHANLTTHPLASRSTRDAIDSHRLLQQLHANHVEELDRTVAGDPFEQANTDHVESVKAIPRDSLGWVAGYRIRHTPDGQFQIETQKTYHTGTAEEVSERIRDAWRYASAQKNQVDAAFKRAAEFQEPAWFGGGDHAEEVKRRRAAVPVGASGVSLEPNTRGRTGTVVRDEETGQTHLLLDGGKEIKAVDFEPLESQFSWRAPERAAPPKPKHEQGDMFLGEDRDDEDLPFAEEIPNGE